MTNEEIKDKIKKNNDEIQALLNPNLFVLNTRIRDLLKDNEQLQKQCHHAFLNGECVYCQMQEGAQEFTRGDRRHCGLIDEKRDYDANE